ncbi:MAG TPA: hypothetical protein PKE39_17085 [Ignavibacteria bacterium]|nr:hypothetical protein [Ignavibacteria bacterium]HMR00742.1 hypothetical protein [Ignavibacteria bacterium]
MFNKLIAVLILITACYRVTSQDNPFYIEDKSGNKGEIISSPFLGDTTISVQGMWSSLNALPISLMGTNT